MRFAGRHQRIPQFGRAGGVAPYFVTEFAAVPGARDHDRNIAQFAGGEAEPAQFGHRWLVPRRGDQRGEDFARQRALERNIGEVIGRGPYPHFQPAFGRQLPQPYAAPVFAADPAEIGLVEPEHRAVVDHAAGGVAHRGIDDLTHRQLGHVAGDGQVHQRFGVGAGDFEFAQGRQVEQHGALAAGPVFGDGAVVVVRGGQPESAIIDHLPSESAGARVESRFTGELGGRVWGHAMGIAGRERGTPVIKADMDVGRVPAVGRIDIVGAR